MSLTTNRWAVRTVKNNRVTICGIVYICPIEVDPGDRFEGKRMMFGRYPQGNRHLPFVEMWGTEKQARESTKEYKAGWPGITCHEDGRFYWMNWREEE